MLVQLGLHFGLIDPKDHQRSRDLMAEYSRLMAQYTDHELEAAADIVIARHRFRTWPTVAECIAALEDHRASVRAAARQPEHERAVHPYPAWSRERIAKAGQLINCDLGRKAAREGWILSLHDFCRNHERLPMDREIPALMAAARFVDRFMANAVDRRDLDLPYASEDGAGFRMDLGTQANLHKLGQTMLDERAKLAAQIGDAA
jgi:hypothetical protein